ncbi:MAG TPA: hypothetical protein VFH14_00110 [Gemmatimonadaceae bacterium]|nr:hypothetical protein [Gemmatimonadaceae bacterium]
MAAAFAASMVLTLATPIDLPTAAAAECTLRVGPGIPPPTSVPSGIPGFHAAWYGQSGYPTLCPGQTARAVVAYYNSGSLGWSVAPLEYAALGTWGPSPGQDQPSVLGGDGTRGTPNTRFPGYNRPAAMPAGYIGPGQVAWFQFTVKAPSTPGTYRFYLRPLIEGVQWMEDYGVFWQVTVVPASPPGRVTVSTANTPQDFFTAGASLFRYDRNDSFEANDAVITYEQFEAVISMSDLVDMRYEPTPEGVSSFNVVGDFGAFPPTVTAEVGNLDGGPTRNDVTVTVTPPASGGSTENWNQRALVAAGTMKCEAISGWYQPDHPTETGSFVDRNLASGTYCYRSGPQSAGWNAFAYSAPVTVPAP